MKTAPQPSLFGEPDEPTDRLILAIYPDRNAAHRIVAERQVLIRQHGLKGSVVDVERLHLTLIHIGDFYGLPQGIAAALKDAAAKVSAPACDVALNRAMSFSGPPDKLPFVLLAEGAESLMDLQSVLRAELAKAGVRHKSGTQFTPHVTLLRDRLSAPEQSIEPIRWTAGEFVLVHSLLGQSRHIPLKRFALS